MCEQAARSRSSPNKKLKLAFSIALTLLGGELACRLALSSQLSIRPDGLGYRYHPRYGWFPPAKSHSSFRASRSFSFRHNEQGFRDVTWPARKKRPRVVVLGDSFAWGFDADLDERMTSHLQASLPSHDVLNLGVTGYGTDQALLLAEDKLPSLAPDLVICLLSHNDVEDNNSNHRNGYYKPWFTAEGSELQLRGVPVPLSWSILGAEHSLLFKSFLVRAIAKCVHRARAPKIVRRSTLRVTFALLEHMNKLARELGAKFVIACEASPGKLTEHFSKRGIPWVDLSGLPSYPGNGRHWTPAGNRLAGRRLALELKRSGLLIGAKK